MHEFPFTTKDGRSGIVRVAAPGDARASNEIVREAMKERPRTLMVDEKEFWSIRDWRRYRLDWGPRGVWLVADLQGAIAGNVTVARGERYNARHTAEIGITVRSSMRDVGVGRALMQTAESWAEEFAVTKLTLRVFSENARARALYGRMGYVEEGLQRGQVKFSDGQLIDTVLMAKFLEP